MKQTYLFLLCAGLFINACGDDSENSAEDMPTEEPPAEETTEPMKNEDKGEEVPDEVPVEIPVTEPTFCQDISNAVVAYANEASATIDEAKEGTPFSDANLAINGVRGRGLGSGSLDVFSLDKTVDGSITLSYEGGRFCDGQGADIKVFENPFGSAAGVFFEPIIVSVSSDGESYVSFPHSFDLDSDLRINAVERWQGFAGMQPVYFHEENTAEMNVFSEAAGGDSFDLQDLPPGPQKDDILKNGVRFIKLQAAQAAVNPEDQSCGETSCYFPILPGTFGGFADVDGLYGRYILRD
ncbi:MAG: LIC_13355 family lipoprotein [Pseudobacteriovorax sp.]|nr:LIC_13355 family lipoprotein [Pseudobacteriovorax sp.]